MKARAVFKLEDGREIYNDGKPSESVESMPFAGIPGIHFTMSGVGDESFQPLLAAAMSNDPQGPAPDVVTVALDEGIRKREIVLTTEGGQPETLSAELSIICPTVLFVQDEAMGFMLGEAAMVFSSQRLTQEQREQVSQRNQEHKLKPEPVLAEYLDKWLQSNARLESAHQDGTYPVHTGEEWLACSNFLDDAKRRRNLTADPQRGSIRHRRSRAPFSAEVVLLDDEREAGHGIELLQGALDKLDADDKLIWLYVSQLLAPVEPLLQNTTTYQWIDLDDVAIKTLGGYARNPQEKVERRAKVYHAIRMAARTDIIGSRSTRYVDKQTGQVINTRLHTKPWGILGSEMPEQPTLFAVDTVPVRIRLVASPEWSALTTHRNTSQYLPFGEIIGAIPGSKAGGAWARSLGLAYLDWCRMNAREALAETPTLFARQWFLDRHRAKIAPYDEVLDGQHPSEVWKHWHAAEELLREARMIDAPLSSIKPLQRQGWAADWKREPPPWKPGVILRPVLEGLIREQYIEKPRQLNPAKRKPGRPRKNPPAE